MTLSSYEEILRGRTVLVTGHTGFTGGWACLWLQTVGARVVGYSLEPDTTPNLFTAAGVGQGIESHFADVCDFDALMRVMTRAKPDVVLHLAAQPLVRLSHREPLRTFAANTMGTVNILEAVRLTPGVRGLVCVTTDKVYKNHEEGRAFREGDELGGRDPYSASKAAAEMAIDGYRRSFFMQPGTPLVFSARGGNIVGGGDWSEDRLIPDCVRAAVGGTTLSIRYPEAVRPWQHVLALTQGYLTLLAEAFRENGREARQAWNFGPAPSRPYSVREVVDMFAANWRTVDVEYLDGAEIPECSMLTLDSSAARDRLDWRPRWSVEESIAMTAAWYRDYYADPARARELTLAQIHRWRTGGGDS